MRHIVLNIGAISAPISRGGTICSLDMKTRPKSAYTTQQSARQIAEKLAAENPGQMFAVLSPVMVFEAKTPTIVEKHFNEQGELVVKEKTNG